MGKPRNAARARATGFKPRRRKLEELTPREESAAYGHLWFALMCMSGKERLVEQALALLGYPASFSARDVHYRRVGPRTRKALTQTHEKYTRATIPGYVFLGVPIREDQDIEQQGLPWAELIQAKEDRSPGGMSFVQGFIATGERRRPARISPWSIREAMADSQVPLYLGEDDEKAFGFDYGAATADQILEVGDEVEIVRGPLKGQRFPFKAASGVYLVCQAPFGDIKIPASQAVAAE